MKKREFTVAFIAILLIASLNLCRYREHHANLPLMTPDDVVRNVKVFDHDTDYVQYDLTLNPRYNWNERSLEERFDMAQAIILTYLGLAEATEAGVENWGVGAYLSTGPNSGSGAFEYSTAQGNYQLIIRENGTFVEAKYWNPLEDGQFGTVCAAIPDSIPIPPDEWVSKLAQQLSANVTKGPDVNIYSVTDAVYNANNASYISSAYQIEAGGEIIHVTNILKDGAFKTIHLSSTSPGRENHLLSACIANAAKLISPKTEIHSILSNLQLESVEFDGTWFVYYQDNVRYGILRGMTDFLPITEAIISLDELYLMEYLKDF